MLGTSTSAWRKTTRFLSSVISAVRFSHFTSSNGSMLGLLNLCGPIGTVRVVEDGRIHLRTDLVRAESPAFQAGAFIPIQNKAEFTVKKYATTQTLVFGRIVLVPLPPPPPRPNRAAAPAPR